MSFYTTVPNDLRDFLTKLPTFGVPAKGIDAQWLAQVGYAGSNQKSILNVLRQIGAIDEEGKPTDIWHALRAKDKDAVGEAVREAYADLFSTFNDAHKRDDEVIANFYRGSTNYSANTLSKVVRTFRVLAEFGDLDSTRTKIPPPKRLSDAEEAPPTDDEKTVGKAKMRTETPQGVNLTVNIQLQIPATAEAKVYEQLFAAMRKNLIDLIDTD